MARRTLAALLLLLLSVLPLQAAQIAVDVDTGTVLAESEADELRRPASLVKLMTAYLAFQAMADRIVSEDTEVKVTRHAATRPPVKFGLRKGQTITFGEALEAAVIGSKNDAAAVVADAVAGSEEAFAERMNAAASWIGMRNTHFLNATGLPVEGQQTTARDMALLVSALIRDYPDRMSLFDKRSTHVKGKYVSTTNPLFGRIKGAKGMKSGFTCGGGYSIAGLIERDGRRVIAVSLGHRSKTDRIKGVRKLLKHAMEAGRNGKPLMPQIIHASASVAPWAGPCGNPPKSVPRLKDSASSKITVTQKVPEAEIALFRAEVSAMRDQKTVVELARSMSPPPVRHPLSKTPPPLNGWGVFLGAHRGQAEAEEVALEIRTATELSPRIPIRFEKRERDTKLLPVFYGLDQDTASEACRLARALQRHCLVLSPSHLLNKRARWRN